MTLVRSTFARASQLAAQPTRPAARSPPPAAHTSWPSLAEGVIVAEKTTGHTDRNALMLHPDIMGVSTSFCEDGAVKTSPQRVRNLEVRDGERCREMWGGLRAVGSA